MLMLFTSGVKIVNCGDGAMFGGGCLDLREIDICLEDTSILYAKQIRFF